jgi:voltage-gated sodium channel
MFAVLAMLLFANNDPFHFGYLHRAMLSLFRIVTFEDWTDIM